MTTEAAKSSKQIKRNAKGQIVAGSGALNPGGRPRSMRKLLLERLGEDGMDVFIEKLAATIEGYTIGDKLPELAAWFLAREYPTVTKVEVTDDPLREASPEVPTNDEIDAEVARILAGKEDEPGDGDTLH